MFAAGVDLLDYVTCKSLPSMSLWPITDLQMLQFVENVSKMCITFLSEIIILPEILNLISPIWCDCCIFEIEITETLFYFGLSNQYCTMYRVLRNATIYKAIVVHINVFLYIPVIQNICVIFVPCCCFINLSSFIYSIYVEFLNLLKRELMDF